ncbi:MAG: feruloyl esterase, partial [Clostridia bacterium]|nr:feruloyl esterase [Clostridia bacterium]
MTREEFYLNDDGIRLHAKLDRPDAPEKCPLCIVIHGLTGNMEERQNVAVSRAMNELGIATL